MFAATAVVAGILGGCGSSDALNPVPVERGIAESILAQDHLYARVSCPSGIPRVKSYRFNCTAYFAAGSYPVAVREVNGKGNVSWKGLTPITTLKISRVRSAIANTLLAKFNVTADVVCPDEALQQKGLKFTCVATVPSTAKVKAAKYRFTVTEVDSHGHVTYVEER